jgi:hypothetical protein
MLRRGESAVVTVPVPATKPDPYQGWLESIAVRVEIEPQMIIARSGCQLVFRGGQKSLAVLADNVETLAQDLADSDRHTHIEYFPGHYYLREGSIPLVVAVR